MEAVKKLEQSIERGLHPPSLSPCLPATGVYFITDGEFGKVGIARDPHARLGLMQCGNARELSLIFFEVVSNPRLIERMLHAKFADRLVRGEWFRVDRDEFWAGLHDVTGIAVPSKIEAPARDASRTKKPLRRKDMASTPTPSAETR